MPSYCLREDPTVQTSRHILAMIHIIMLSVLCFFFVDINKKIKKHEYCPMKKLKNMDVVFYSLLSSFILNISYLAFQYKFPPTNIWIPLFSSVVLILVGVVCMVFSVLGFMETKSTKDQPIDCHSFIKKINIFFILTMSLSVAQAVFSIWTLQDFITVNKSISR